MIVVTIKTTIYPDKQTEFLQTARLILTQIRKKPGCMNSFLYQDVENEQVFCFMEEWQTQQDVERHLRTDIFGALLGAMTVLGKPPEVKLDTISHTAGMEMIKMVRER